MISMQFLNCSMFDNRNLINPPSDRIPVFLKQQHSLISLKDGLSSLTYRINEIQNTLSKKIDRSQFMSILDKKISFGHLKHCIDELQSKIKEEHRLQQERNDKMQSIAIHKINDLSKKLKTVNISNRGNSSEMKGRTKPGKGQKQRVIQTNELLIQSNQTMFSLIIDEIAKLQEKDSQFEKQLQSRNKRMVNLNNEVCKKLEKLESEIENKFQTRTSGQPMESKYMGNSWSQLDRQSKPTLHKGSEMQSSTFESVRFQMISRNIEAIQKQLLGKMNIKDVLPIIKQSSNSITSNIHQIRQYVQESIESTRKILASQTEINHELSSSHRVGCWHSLSQYNQIAVISKQIINLVPQIFQVTQQSYCNFISIFQQGLYLIKILPLTQINNYISDNSQDSTNSFDEFQVMIGTEVCTLSRQSLLRLQKNSQLRVILRDHAQIVICLQKL